MGGGGKEKQRTWPARTAILMKLGSLAFAFAWILRTKSLKM